MKDLSNRYSLLRFCVLFFQAVFLLSGCNSINKGSLSVLQGAIVRGDSTQQKMTFVFTGDTFADGSEHIRKILKKHNIKSAFFFTGNFYRNPDFKESIQDLIAEGHYLGAHSDRHLLYCDWDNRDSLLVNEDEFTSDLEANYKEMLRFGIAKEDAPYFLPPYEWYNETIAEWTKKNGLQLINMTRGTLSHVDYTTPKMPNYRSSQEIQDSILNFGTSNPNGLNGFVLLMHIGTDKARKDKFHLRLEELILSLKSREYIIISLEKLLAKS